MTVRILLCTSMRAGRGLAIDRLAGALVARDRPRQFTSQLPDGRR